MGEALFTGEHTIKELIESRSRGGLWRRWPLNQQLKDEELVQQL